MKNIIFLLSFLSLGYASQAQFGNAAVFPLVAGDTLTNADTVVKVIKASAGYSAEGIQINLNKISGTIAGKAYLYQSLDGVNYWVTDSATYTTLSTTTPSIQNPTATAIATFSKVESPSVYYAVVAISSGTVSAQIRVYYTLRKKLTVTSY